jgi:hypothetical protein
MFVDAINKVLKFTRPLHSISRNYGSTTIYPGAATLFFVNSVGWALTCKHVTNQIIAAKSIVEKYAAFKKELASLEGTMKRNKMLKQLEKKYDYTEQTTIELRNRFMGCVEGKLELKMNIHKKYDIALIKFENYTRLLCNAFPVFPADTSGLQPGKMLCRLGYPFPEFTNFEYDEISDTLIWNDKGRKSTPRFPIEGMITRRVLDDEGKVFAFEMSTPGLRGQSGGPVFDTEGKVWGIQSQTAHRDLDFDVDQEVIRLGTKKRITDSAFLHVGICLHVDVLKSFMKEYNVSFKED